MTPGAAGPGERRRRTRVWTLALGALVALAAIHLWTARPGASPPRAASGASPAPAPAAAHTPTRTAPPAARLAASGLDPVVGGDRALDDARVPAGRGTSPQDGHGEGSGAQDHAAEGGDGGTHRLPYARIFLVLITILLVGKLFGEVVERIGQPSVLGELLAGVVLGGSVLGVIPASGTEIGDIVHVFAEIGVAILLFEIGLETDLKEMFRVGPSASAVALVGIALPFLMGFLYWFYVDPQISAHPEGITFWMVAIFVGATLTATSVGITARVLSDLDQMHTSEARIIIGAAVIDDVLGIVILAVVAGMAAGAGAPEAIESFFSSVGMGADASATLARVADIARIFVFAVGYLVLAVWIGNKAAPYLFDLVDRMRVRGVLLVSAFCFALLLAALADLSGSAMIIGAFAAGIVLSSTNQFDTVVQRIEPVADVFTPIFFVVVGAPVNVDLFIPGTADFNLGVLGVGLLLTVIAVVGKVVAGWATRNAELNRLAIGVGMIPRGEVGLIFASIGLSGGILSSEVYSAVLIMVILSTFIVPPLLKVIFTRGGATAPESAAGRRAEEVGQEVAREGVAGVTEGEGRHPGSGGER